MTPLIGMEIAAMAITFLWLLTDFHREAQRVRIEIRLRQRSR